MKFISTVLPQDIPFFEIADHKILVNPTIKLKEKYTKIKHDTL